MLLWLATSCLVLPLAAVGPGDVPEDPGDWIETDPPNQGSDRWFAANHDVAHQWVVSLRDGRPRVGRLDRKTAEAPAPLPFPIKEGMAEEGLAGRRRGVKVSDGWLVAFNAGEFGAGLWWFSPDGTDRYKIAEAWVVGFVPTGEGVLALEGLAHMGLSRGRLLRLTRGPGGRWRSEDLVDLKHAPETFAKADDGSLIVATTDRLLRVVPAERKVEALLDGTFWGGLYPNSLVVTPAGVAYLGMRHGVARVETRGGPPKVRWLLPNKAFDEMEPDSRLK